ncbi:hypothetical protein QBZ16_002262 [Prototheca wickerhamii]|uniref:EF-hand domain-containing protein n=1 Tax=Prototheca wickerhamii TaxID=3111 RepID=A0AAD9INP8_PROWI|nr:hypothetical protein QBZ16_002262 [Prototheca wickerhamii]
MEEKTSIRAYYASAAEARVGDAVRRWLRVHGRTVRPRIGPKKVEELKLCFQMMDEDGSGAIDIEELSEAFKAEMTNKQIQTLVESVDKDHTGEIELGEFIEMMSEQLGRRPDDPDGRRLLSLDVSVIGYRRVKLLKALRENDRAFLQAAAATQAALARTAASEIQEQENS